DYVIRARQRVRLRRDLRRVPQSSGADHVAVHELPLGSPKLLLGLTLAAGAAQQSNQRGLGRLVGWLEETEIPRIWQGFLGYALEVGYQRRQKPHSQPPCFLTFPDAP